MERENKRKEEQEGIFNLRGRRLKMQGPHLMVEVSDRDSHQEQRKAS
jgi:hypothetical protein